MEVEVTAKQWNSFANKYRKNLGAYVYGMAHDETNRFLESFTDLRHINDSLLVSIYDGYIIPNDNNGDVFEQKNIFDLIFNDVLIENAIPVDGRRWNAFLAAYKKHRNRGIRAVKMDPGKDRAEFNDLCVHDDDSLIIVYNGWFDVGGSESDGIKWVSILDLIQEFVV